MDDFDLVLKEARISFWEQTSRWIARKGRTDLDGGCRDPFI